MSTASQSSARIPPRVLIRVFWVIHRALVRVSGGRIGISRPKQGKSFGTLRLTTIGRRSGQPRETMVGYFEDGESIVTLAMNGWAHAEPAWWLNLQANPDATVLLPTGAIRVRARAATAVERERLWPRFAAFPGWGDVNALASRRGRETAVVVLDRPESLG